MKGGAEIDPIDVVSARLYARFPGETANVARQIDLAIACAEYLRVTLTPELLETLVTDGLRSRPGAARTSPAVPLLCNGR